MKIKFFLMISAAIIPSLTGCASNPVALAPIGPDPASRAAAGPAGCLQVFSATEKSPPVASDDNACFNLHSGYSIYDKSGQTVKFVANHASNLDEWPDVAVWPAGTYNIVAESARCGLVTVPVVIQQGKTTVVHLDDNWRPSSQTSANELVCLPDGEAAGWRGSAAKPPA